MRGANRLHLRNLQLPQSAPSLPAPVSQLDACVSTGTRAACATSVNTRARGEGRDHTTCLLEYTVPYLRAGWGTMRNAARLADAMLHPPGPCDRLSRRRRLTV